MQLSSDILSQFAKVTKDETATKQESIVYGTIIESNGEKYVQIDGSDLLTPMASTTNMSDGERVTVMIKNHMAVVTGNVTSPAVRDGDVDDKVSDVKKLVVEDLKATNAEIENLKAQNAEIENLVAGKITVGQLNAVRAEIEELIAKKADIEHLDATYANIDFANISKAAMEYFYATSGLIKDVVIGDGTITGNLVGVTIKGDLIEGNTVVAEKLVIKGTDGLYYKLNTDGMKVEAQQTDYNSLNGSIITAKSITATKISVSDLVAFDATIGGFNITDSAIYSGVKESVGNTTRGIYLDKTGQFAFGDSNNFLKFYKDSNGAYKLEISAASIKMGTSGTNVETAINNVKNSVDNIQIGGRNYILGTGTPYTAVGNGSRQWLFPWHCASVEATNSLFGKTVTISFDYETAITSGSFSIHIGGTWQGVEAFDSYGKIGHASKIIAVNVASVTDDVFIYIDGTWTGSVTFSNMKVEIGNKATDWSPAPEDTDAAIAKATEATLEITDESITSSVKTINTELEKKVDSSYLEENYSTIKQTDDKIKSEVGKVVVGGRNLLRSNDPLINNGWCGGYVADWYCRNGMRIGFGGTGIDTTKDISANFEEIYISPGDYTISFYGWQWNLGGAYPTLYFDMKSSDGALEHNVIETKLEDTAYGGSIKKYTGTLRVEGYNGMVKPRFIVVGTFSSGDIGITEWKLEQGNKATDWSPAPEDVDAELDVVRTAVQEITPEYIVQEVRKSDAYKNDLSSLKVSSDEIIATVTTSETYKGTIDTFQTQIKANSDAILLQASKTVGGRNYILGTGTPYTAVGTGTRQWLYPWKCASIEAANSLFGKTVTISFDYDAAITSGSLLVQTNILWWGVKSFGVGTESNHFSLTRKYDAATTADDVFIYLDGTWTGSVTFRNLKVEIGDMATDWTPAPEDAAKSVDTGGAVRIDQTGVHMSGGTIEMETADGDEYIHIRNDGISASSLSAPNVAKRYSGPTGLYVNPNATSSQIAAGNYFRSLTDALATINNRMLDYNVFVNMSSGMSDYADAVISGVYGDGAILIYGENATVYGTVTVRNSHAQVIISSLHVAIPSGVERAAYEVRNAFLTIYSSTMSGNHRAFTVDVNGYLDARSCVFKVNAENSAYVLRSTAHFEECIGNGRMLCHRGNMTAYGKVPIGNVEYWESCVPNNVSSLTPTGTDGTPAAPVISTVTYNYTSSDSYRGGWSYFDTDAPRQGFNGMDIYGTIWFDAAAIRSALSGKTIKQASLRLFMVKGVGRGRSVVVQLHGTNMGYNGRSGRPELTTSYGTIGTTEPDMNNEMTIPTAVIDDIVSGKIQALVLKSDDTVEYKDKFYSENYARFEGSTSATTADNCPRLTVVYQ